LSYSTSGEWEGSDPAASFFRPLNDLDVDAGNREAIERLALFPTKPFCIIGDVGTGKTTIMGAAARDMPNSWWTSAEEFCDDVKAAIGRKIDPDALEQATAKKTRRLYLDDLGVERPTEFNIVAITTLLKRRFDRGLPTWITTNLTGEEIAERYSARIADRIFGACRVLKLDGKSRRERPE
jgi:DNA replication protein DnaC